MPEEKQPSKTNAAKSEPSSGPLHWRAIEWTLGIWRPIGTLVAILLALLLGWHTFNGKHGITAWHHNRTEDKQLQQEIEKLKQENARLHDHIDRLKNDPEAIEHEARETLHYAKPGEVIYALPPSQTAQPSAAGK